MKALTRCFSSVPARVTRPALFITLLFASFAALAQETPRFEAGGNFVALRAGGTGTFGPGGTAVYNFKRYLSLEGSLNWLPNGSGFSSITRCFEPAPSPPTTFSSVPEFTIGSEGRGQGTPLTLSS